MTLKEVEKKRQTNDSVKKNVSQNLYISSENMWLFMFPSFISIEKRGKKEIYLNPKLEDLH